MNLKPVSTHWRSCIGQVLRSLVLGLGLLGIILVGVLVLRHPATAPNASTSEVTGSDATNPPSPAPPSPAVNQNPPATAQSPAPSQPTAKTPATPVTPAVSILPRGEPTVEARQAVNALTQLDLSSGAISPVQAAVWKESLRALLGQGEAAVPAIREFLERNLDLSFASLENGDLMGTRSLRMALLNAMQEIGGEQAIAGSLQTLQTSADPAELALVAAYLQKADPAQYRDAVLGAAREALSMAAGGQWDGRDVAPLFDVLKTFGGEDAARDIERYANTWFNYTPLVLAELPDGAGIASLIRLAVNADGQVTLGKETYQRMLAQVSAQNVDASAALLQLARDGRIDASAWRAVAEALAGNTLQLVQSPVSRSASQAPSSKYYHVTMGNQNFMEQPAPATMSSDEVMQRIGQIDQLLGVTSSPAAVASLQQARSNLAARL